MSTTQLSPGRDDEDLLDVYNFDRGVRGKYAARYAAGTNIVVLSPDVAEIFPDSQAVNDALRALIELARRQTQRAAG